LRHHSNPHFEFAAARPMGRAVLNLRQKSDW
jgi:hypothetical protein